MEVASYELLLLPAGWAVLILSAWLSELLGASDQDDMFLSTDEQVASDRCSSLYEQFCSGKGFPDLKRREIWRRVGWLWRYGRVLALQSGRLMGVWWLLLYGLACIGVSLVCLVRPRAHTLRLLLGGCDFVSYSSVPRNLVGHIKRTLG